MLAVNGSYLSLLIHDTVAVITIINPIAAASIMIGMLSDSSPRFVKPIAYKATLTLMIASFVTLFGGEFIFKLFGINTLSLKVIGGVILMMIAINMAYGHHSKGKHTEEEHDEAQDKEDISIVPIGIPILFGPGLIATIIVLQSSSMHQFSAFTAYILIGASIIIASIITFFTLYYAVTIDRLLGVTGMKILTRIMGLIVGAIAAQFLISGIKGLWIG